MKRGPFHHLLHYAYFSSVADDAGETFQVKKSSQSRRIMKQKKADKKAERRRERVETEDSPPSEKVVPRLHQEKQPANVIEEDMDIKFKDTLPQRRREEGLASWTLSGREAEALHMEEDDDEDEDDKQESETSRRGASGGPHEPLRDILQSGFFPIVEKESSTLFAHSLLFLTNLIPLWDARN